MFFRFYQAKVLDCVFVQGGPPLGRLAGKNHPRFAPVFFPPSLATKNSQSKERTPVKSGKSIPMGLFISNI